MTAAAVFALLAERFGEDVSAWEDAAGREVKDGVRDAGFTAAPERLPEVMRALRDEPSLRFDFLQNVTAIDWPKEQVLEVVYHLFSYAHRHEIVVKTRAPRDNPRVPSVAGLWKNAGWLEREQYDLLGVVFEGHPDLRRLLMPDDWVGHPMRKDYREAAEYRGMPTTRPSPLDMLVGYDKAQGGAKPPGGAS